MDQELESFVPFIDLKPEKEEATKEMAPNLRVDFKERHRKRLLNALLATPPPTKKSLLEAPREEQALTPLQGRCPPLQLSSPAYSSKASF